MPLLLLVQGLTLHGAATAQAEKELPPASEIVARYVEAIGGRQAMLSHQSSHYQLNFKGPYATADVDIYAARPNWALIRWTRDDTVVSESGFDGDVGWDLSRDLGPRLLEGLELETARWESRFDSEFYDPVDFTAVETTGVTELNGTQCYRLKLVPKVGREWFDDFDIETGLKVGSERTVVGESSIYVHKELLSDYREFGGVLLPTKWVWRYDQWPVEQVLTLQSVEFDSVPEAVFAPPDQLEESSWPFADRLAELLQLDVGQTVADVGAGDGAWSLELARRLGPKGHVLATELLPELLVEWRKGATYEGLTNIAPVLVNQSYTGLPALCCDGIVVRFVYHEFTEPDVMNAGLLRALQPGGRIVVIDAVAEGSNLQNGRGNHTIVPDVLIEEMVAAGFALVSRIDAYNGFANRFAAVLERPN
jgi:SAM-dependent methyltransferase